MKCWRDNGMIVGLLMEITLLNKPIVNKKKTFCLLSAAPFNSSVKSVILRFAVSCRSWKARKSVNPTA